MMHVAFNAVLFHLHNGPEVVLAEVERRSGGYLDPELVAVFRTHGRELLEDLEDLDAHQEVLNAEPDPVRFVDDTDVEAVAGTFGDLVDLKSLVLQGHSAGVAALAAGAGRGLGFDERAVRTVRPAGYLHDLGRAGVSSRIWDKPRALTSAEWDLVRLHAYHSERILARVPELADVALIAGRHHQRCDGSGYHHGVNAALLTMSARVLAAADVYQALVEDRPHRSALTPGQAAGELRGQARAGRLDGDAVSAVLDAAGHSAGVRRERLTEPSLPDDEPGPGTRANPDPPLIVGRTTRRTGSRVWVDFLPTRARVTFRPRSWPCPRHRSRTLWRRCTMPTSSGSTPPWPRTAWTSSRSCQTGTPTRPWNYCSPSRSRA
jgi:HD-GYP domain-containing protein (c-di-GMP phosphodiesterase class II)